MMCIAPRCLAKREVGALFCTTHLAASPGRRGGWMSAEKRRRRLAGSHEAVLDASNIVRRLWVGGKPPFDRDLPEFDVLVLCAEELQPAQLAFHGQVVRVGVPDSVLEQGELNRVISGARIVGRSLLDGQRVLVTCAAGLNRSALVAALGLGMVTRMKPAELVALMRQRRSPIALSNPYFVHVLHRFVIEKPRGERGIKR